MSSTTGVEPGPSVLCKEHEVVEGTQIENYVMAEKEEEHHQQQQQQQQEEEKYDDTELTASVKKQLLIALYIRNIYQSVSFGTFCTFYLKICLHLIKKISSAKAEKILLWEAKAPVKTLTSHLTLTPIPLKLFKNLTKHITVECDREQCILVSCRLFNQKNEDNLMRNGDNSMRNEDNSMKNEDYLIRNEDDSMGNGMWTSMVIENEHGVQFKQIVQVFGAQDMSETEQVLISDKHMFNIIHNVSVQGENTNDKRYVKLDTSKYKVIQLCHLSDYVPQVVAHVDLELINTLHNKPNDNVLVNLCENYFKYPRFHHVGDIIRIHLKEYALDVFKTEEVNYLLESKFVYIKVCSFETALSACLQKKKENADEIEQQILQVNKNKASKAIGSVKQVNSAESYHISARFISLIVKFMKQFQQAFYISNDSSFWFQSMPVASFIPNVLNRSPLYTTDVNVNTVSEYMLDCYNDCSYFKALFKCADFFFSGGSQHLRNCQMLQTFLVTGSPNAGLHDLTQAVADKCGVHIKQVNCITLMGSVPTVLEKNLDTWFGKAKVCAPCMLVFHNIEDICVDHSGSEDPRAMQSFIEHLSDLKSLPRAVIVCTSSKPDKIHHQIKRLFLKTIDVLPPKEIERHSLIDYQLRLVAAEYTFDSQLVDYLAASTGGFERHDLLSLVRRSVKNKSQDQNEKNLLKEDFKKVHAELGARHSDRLDAPSVPNVSWEDIGGLSKLKEVILSTFRALKRSSGLKRSGLLLHGPPGTGKTLIAKAVATQCRMNFLAVKGPELLNKYVGQSEENIRNVFMRARSAAPCVVFFDELDSLAPRRGQEDQSSGVMDRVVSQFLAEMDGIHATKDIFILGATNRVDLLDPAILRPGRFDKSLCVGLYEDRTSQLGVLKAVVRKFHLSEDVQLDALVEHFPGQMSGADMYSICSDAWTHAVRRIITETAQMKTVSAQLKKAKITVNMADFLAACPSEPVTEVESASVNTTPEIQVA